jgi:hypothetical protein
MPLYQPCLEKASDTKMIPVNFKLDTVYLDWPLKCHHNIWRFFDILSEEARSNLRHLAIHEDIIDYDEDADFTEAIREKVEAFAGLKVLNEVGDVDEYLYDFRDAVLKGSPRRGPSGLHFFKDIPRDFLRNGLGISEETTNIIKNNKVRFVGDWSVPKCERMGCWSADIKLKVVKNEKRTQVKLFEPQRC